MAESIPKKNFLFFQNGVKVAQNRRVLEWNSLHLVA